MRSFETKIAKYNATLPTIQDGCGRELQLTEYGVLITTVKDDDGTDVIVSTGEDVSGGNDRGFIVYGIDGNDTAQPISLDSNGNVNVNIAAGSITVDFTPGTDYDEGSDELGSETEPGVFCGITTTSYTDIVSIPIANGATVAIEAFDFTADVEGQFQLVVETSGATQYIRTSLLPENQGSNQILFPRPKEITAADESTVLKLKAKSLRDCDTMCAAGGINAYLKPE